MKPPLERWRISLMEKKTHWFDPNQPRSKGKVALCGAAFAQGARPVFQHAATYPMCDDCEDHVETCG